MTYEPRFPQDAQNHVMRDILLGAALLVAAVLLFLGAVLEWSTLAIVLSAVLFLAVALVWLTFSDSSGPRGRNGSR